jgi:hypothetical protein
MRPVLLKSAGIVGLAGAIMAMVSSNALFVDPGGPDRSSRPAAEVAAPAQGVIMSASEATSEGDEIASLLPRLTPPETLPPVEDVQPETTASVIPAERAPAPPPSAAPSPRPEPVATTAPVAPAPSPAATPKPVVVVAVPAEAVPLPSSPAPPQGTLTAADQAIAVPPAAVTDQAERATTVSGLWPKDSLECPRDWVPAADAASAANPPAGCQTLASLVQPEAGDRLTLRKALPEEVLDLVALAPTIPIPGTNAGPDAEGEASAPPEEAKPEEKPKPVRANHRTSWPDEPPPNCGAGKHAYWHFTDRKAGTKEWYCR